MSNITIAPENLEVANAYLSTGDALTAASQLGVSPDRVYEVLEKSEVKRYVDAVYQDQGYRNRFKLAELLDEILESKIKEARESEVYSSKDLVDIIQLAHKISQDHSKVSSTMHVKNQQNIQVNGPFGEGNYGELMGKLLGNDNK